jgi:hypothetical protein
MTTRTIETAVNGLNELADSMNERTTTRRGFLRYAAKTLGLAAAAGLALPAAGALAADTSGLDEIVNRNGKPNKGNPDDPGDGSGVDLLRAWAAGELPADWLPGDDWEYYESESSALRFEIPSGWTVSEVHKSGQSGAWVVSEDKSFATATLRVLAEGPVNASDGALWEIGEALGDGDYTAIYNDSTESRHGSDCFLALDLDTSIFVVHAVAAEDGADTTLDFWIQVGPKDAFDRVTEEAFLPFMIQFAIDYGVDDSADSEALR